MTEELICVLDVGKTHSKIALLDRKTAAVTWSIECTSGVKPGAAFCELDAAAIEKWLIVSLKNAPNKDCIRTIVPVAHGAAAAFLDRHGKLLALPDYEDCVFDSVRSTYARLRDPFCATFSPPLPLGLNLGIQLFYLQSHHLALFEQTHAILLYPQYWAWRLSGVIAREVTSLGCHTDLWLPVENRFSQLAAWQGWAEMFPSLRRASDVLGTLTPDMATATGLDRSCRVLCGIHDSNASYLGQVAGFPPDQPVTVISSGTWTLIMCRGGDLGRLRAELDMLANVDVIGTPLSTARFMGGREYQAITGNHNESVLPDTQALQRVIDAKALALPSFAPAGGPFAGMKGDLIHSEGLAAREHAALATLYIALMSDLILDFLGTGGDIIIDGPLATSPLFGPLLSALRPDRRILLSAGAGAGATRGAYHLVESFNDHVHKPVPVSALSISGLDGYRSQWRHRVHARQIPDP
jgi:sugar (pentulose or hexulose) kinase